MTTTDDTQEIPVRDVTISLCELCINGAGGECHTPGCALWMNRAPDLPVWAAMTGQEVGELCD